MLTADEIRNLSEEDLKKANIQLMKGVALRMGLLFGVKLGVLLLLRAWAKKASS